MQIINASVVVSQHSNNTTVFYFCFFRNASSRDNFFNIFFIRDCVVCKKNIVDGECTTLTKSKVDENTGDDFNPINACIASLKLNVEIFVNEKFVNDLGHLKVIFMCIA